MPPTPLVAVACGAGAATATQVIDPADGLEFGAGISALVGNSLVVSRAGEVPDHSLPRQIPRQAGTDQPVLRITDASRGHRSILGELRYPASTPGRRRRIATENLIR